VRRTVGNVEDGDQEKDPGQGWPIPKIWEKDKREE